ncbi:MAG: aldo/keto reductase [Alloprevotella sp.]
MHDPLKYRASDDRYERSEGFYRRCGRSGILLPAVSLGLWKNFGDTVPYERSRALLLHAFDCGVCHFDLANNYGPPYGSAEQTFGRVMREALHPYRDELFVATKAGYDMWRGPYGNWGSRKYLMASLDQSLRRMNLDYVDLFYSHRFDPVTPLDETLQALVDIVKSGKALYVGISRWPLDATRHALDYLRRRDVPCLCYQGRINLLDREPLTSGILSAVHSEGCGFVSFSPLAQGLLAGRYSHGIPESSRMRRDVTLREEQLTSELCQKLGRFCQLAAERGETAASLALRWVLSLQGVTSVIVGASSVEQLDESLLAAGIPALSDEEMEILDLLFETRER